MVILCSCFPCFSSASVEAIRTKEKPHGLPHLVVGDREVTRVAQGIWAALMPWKLRPNRLSSECRFTFMLIKLNWIKWHRLKARWSQRFTFAGRRFSYPKMFRQVTFMYYIKMWETPSMKFQGFCWQKQTLKSETVVDVIALLKVPLQ